MNETKLKKIIGQAAIVALCVALLIYIALIPTVTHSDSSVLNISSLYGVTALLSFVVLLGYCVFVKQREKTFILLFCAILTVNCGYFFLSVARDLQFALIANRVSYFGAAFLPTIMLVLIMDLCQVKYTKTLVRVLFTVSLLMFLLAASGGILDIYYKEVSIEIIDGVTHLHKEYGPLHWVYSVYLFASFGLMIGLVVYSFVRGKITSFRQASVVSAMVFGNIAVWFVEQLVDTDFEFLSVSYVATELFLLLFYMMLQDLKLPAPQTEDELLPSELPPDMEELLESFLKNAAQLTATEKNILRHYADGDDIHAVAEKSFISIHTVRKHNANIYHKLNVGSREELLLYIELFRRCGRLDELL